MRFQPQTDSARLSDQFRLNLIVLRLSYVKIRIKLTTSSTYCAIKEHRVRIFCGCGELGTETISADVNPVPVTMHRRTSSRPISRVGALAFVGLAFCVFMWGLQYKLSLYDSPGAASHQIPRAKLLSKNEQSGSTESPLVVRARTSTRTIYTVPTVYTFILLLVLRHRVKIN